MAAVTAYILIGQSHPNETSLDPQWIIKLWEGDSANWVLSAIDGSAPQKESRPKNPDEILSKGCEFARRVAQENGLDSVAIIALDDSHIASHLERAAKFLPDVNLHIMRSIGSRTTSQWQEGWQNTGELS